MDQNLPIEGKRLEIVKFAFDRFYDGGFHATGMEAAMAGSGISKRTLYKYFPSKEDLIEAVLRLYSEAIIHELFDPVSGISDPRQQLHESNSRVVDVVVGPRGGKARQTRTPELQQVVEAASEEIRCECGHAGTLVTTKLSRIASSARTTSSLAAMRSGHATSAS